MAEYTYMLKQARCQRDTALQLPEVTADDIRKHALSLKNGKAADAWGITAEHIKHAHPYLFEVIAQLLNSAIQRCSMPHLFKEGLIAPIFKKKGSRLNPDKYRRITLTSLVGKLLEKIMIKPTKSIFAPQQNRLQRGFTDHASSINTALILTETIAEAFDAKKPMYVTMMDASKAFDVVWHTSLLNKLHDIGVDSNLWLLYDDMYSGLSSRVRWDGEITRVLSEKQGVRQGGIASAELFKIQSNNHLNRIEDSGLGSHIGSISVAIPTCADDSAATADSLLNMQTMLNIGHGDSRRERYDYSGPKTKLTVFTKTKWAKAPTELTQMYLGDTPLELVDTQLHLGIVRTADGKANATVEKNIKTARRTSYALMGAGLHGLNGLHPSACMKIWDTYVLPILTYGLDVLRLTATNTLDMERVRLNALKRYQNLPTRTATEGVYILSGALPIEAILDRQMLTLLGNVARHPGTAEYDILLRQLAVKDDSSNSLIVTMRGLLAKYDLPTAWQVFSTKPSKDNWKLLVKRAIRDHWRQRIISGADEKSTLEYLNHDTYNPGSLHPLWLSTDLNPYDIRCAAVKVKVLTGTYQLATRVAVQSGTSATCSLCNKAEETTTHFLLQCPELQEARCRHMTAIQKTLEGLVGYGQALEIMQNHTQLTQIILDASYNDWSNTLDTQYFLLEKNILGAYAMDYTMRGVSR